MFLQYIKTKSKKYLNGSLLQKKKKKHVREEPTITLPTNEAFGSTIEFGTKTPHESVIGFNARADKSRKVKLNSNTSPNRRQWVEREKWRMVNGEW